MRSKFLLPILLVLAALPLRGQDGNSTVMHCQPGPWGHIDYQYIYLAAPDSILDDFPLPSPQSRWCFAGHNLDWVKALLASVGYDSATVTRLTADPRSAPDEEGVITIFPAEEDVLALSDANRITLYKELAKYTQNPFFHDPICIPDGDVDSWLRDSVIPKNVTTLIHKLVYRDADGYFFSDLRLILKYAQTDTDARLWVKALTRVRAVVAQVKVNKDDDLVAIRRYWSADYHRSDSLPMLDGAIQAPEGGMTLDLTHLLPPIPRRLVYSYVSPDIERTGQTPNCHWTSLNFFNYTRQNILLDLKLATSEVLANYEQVSPPYQFGDVLFFLAANGDAFHSCVYVADNLVFTKNGENEIMPWLLTRIDDVKQLYSREPGYHIQAFRRKWPEGG